MRALRKAVAIALSLSMFDLGPLQYSLSAVDPSQKTIEDPKFSFNTIIHSSLLQQYAFIGKKFISKKGAQSPRVIHIRDLHCNEEAQTNIAKILKAVTRSAFPVSGNNELIYDGQRVTRNDLLVLVEGAEGEVDTSLFSSFPDAEIRRTASKEFVKEGKMTGPEYLSIAEPEVPIKIMGIEDGDLYLQNFKAFRNVIGQKQVTGEFIKEVEENLEGLKEKVYSKELLELDEKVREYKEGKIDLQEYAMYLSNLINDPRKTSLTQTDTRSAVFPASEPESSRFSNTPNFALLIQVLKAQKGMDLDKVEKERNELMEELSQKLPKEELGRIIKKSLEFRLGRVTAVEYFGGLEVLGKRIASSEDVRSSHRDELHSVTRPAQPDEKVGLPWSQASSTPFRSNPFTQEYPSLGKYIALVKEQGKIDQKGLHDELEGIANELTESMIKTEEEREVLELGRQFELLKKMFSLELTREELKTVTGSALPVSGNNDLINDGQRSRQRIEDFMSELGRLALKHGIDVPQNLKGEERIRNIAKVFEDGERFYELALKRDQMMLSKALQALETVPGSALPVSGNNDLINDGQRIAVLITGGFHSEGVTELLKQYDISHIVLTPRVRKEPDMRKYQALMMDERISFQTLAFFSIFSEKMMKLLTEKLQDPGFALNYKIELLDDVLKLSRVRRIDRGKLEAWIRENQARGEKDRQIQEKLSEIEESLEGGQEETDYQLILGDEEIRSLIEDGSMLAAELTVEILETLPESFKTDELLSAAKKLLEERRKREEESVIARPGPKDAGLIGKYQVLSDLIFDETKGILSFKGRHIETGAEELIEIGAKKVDRAQTIDNRFDLYLNHEITDVIADWFTEEFSGKVLLLEKNDYGIEGIGTTHFMGVARRFENERVAFFHEIAEAMGASGQLTAEGIVQSLEDRSWYDSHMTKPGREGMKFHYALRALQREVFKQEDLDLTYVIKGRLSLTEARDFVRAQLKERSLTLSNRGPLIADFRRERTSLQTREQELALLDSLIDRHIGREKEELEKRRQEAEEAARRKAEEIEERRMIDEIIQGAKSRLPMGKTFIESPSDEADVKKRDQEVLGILERLKGKNDLWVAEALFKASSVDLKMSFVSQFPHFLFTQGLRTQNVGAMNQFLALMYEGAMKATQKRRESDRLVRDFETVVYSLGGIELEKSDVLNEFLVKSYNELTARRPFVQRYQVSHIPKYEELFDVDPLDPHILYFKKDFERRVKDIRDVEARRLLDKLHKEATFRLKKLTQLSKVLIIKDKRGGYVNHLLSELESRSTDINVRITVLEHLTTAKKDYSPDQVKQLVNQAISIYQTIDASLKIRVMAILVELASITSDLSQQQMIAVLAQEGMDSLLDGISGTSEALREADRQYDAALEVGKEEAQKKVREVRIHQFDLMEMMERRVQLLTALAKRAGETGNADYAIELIRYLVEIARNDKWDSNVSAEIISELSPFLALYPEMQQLSNYVFQTFLERLEPPKIADEIREKLMREAAPEKLVLPATVLELLKRSDLHERTKYLILSRFQKDRSLLESVIFNKDDSGVDLGIDERTRLYALTLYAPQFMSETVDGVRVYNDEQFKTIVESLGAAASRWVDSVKSDNDRIRNLFDYVLLQDEEAKVYTLATYLAMQHHTPLSTAEGFVKTSQLVAKARVRGYWNNANSGFLLGGRLFRKVAAPANFFFHILAHEIAHDILEFSYRYPPLDLKSDTYHEFIADLHGLLLFEIFGLDHKPIMAELDYDHHFDDVVKDDHHTVESHEGARAQLKVLMQAFSSAGSPLNRESLEKIFKFGLAIVADFSKGQGKPNELVELILRRFLGLDESAVKVGDNADIIMRQFLGLGLLDDEFREELYRLPIVGLPAVLALLAQRGTTHEASIDLGKCVTGDTLLPIFRLEGISDGRFQIERKEETSRCYFLDMARRFSSMTTRFSRTLNSSRSTLTLMWFLMIRISAAMFSSFSSTLSNLSFASVRNAFRSSRTVAKPSPNTRNLDRMSSSITTSWFSDWGPLGDVLSFMNGILSFWMVQVNQNIVWLPIISVQSGDYVLSLNESTEKIEPHRIKALMDMGVKPVFRLTTASGRSIRTTANHPYLKKADDRRQTTDDGQWTKVSELTVEDEIAVPKSIGIWTQRYFSDQDVSFFPIKDDTMTSDTKTIDFSSFSLNGIGIMQRITCKGVGDHLSPRRCSIALDETRPDLRDFSISLQNWGEEYSKDSSKFSNVCLSKKKPFVFIPFSSETRRTKPIRAFRGLCRSWESFNTPSFSSDDESTISLPHTDKFSALISKLSSLFSTSQADATVIESKTMTGSDVLWDRVISIEHVGEEQVYDIEVEGTHNFIGNGIFAHNTAIGPGATGAGRQPAIVTGGDLSSFNDRRGFEHGENAERTPEIVGALGRAEFASVTLSGDGKFSPTSFTFKEEIKGDEKGVPARKKRESLTEGEQGVKLTPEQLQIVGEVISETRILEQLEEVDHKKNRHKISILFVQGLKEAHYSLGRRQLYIPVESLNDRQKLSEELYHEAVERWEIMEGLKKISHPNAELRSKYPTLYNEFIDPQVTPEGRSKKLKDAIIKLADESHTRLKVRESVRKILDELKDSGLNNGGLINEVSNRLVERGIRDVSPDALKVIVQELMPRLQANVEGGARKTIGDPMDIVNPASEIEMLKALEGRLKQGGLDQVERKEVEQQIREAVYMFYAKNALRKILEEDGAFLKSVKTGFGAQTIGEAAQMLVNYVQKQFRGEVLDSSDERVEGFFLASETIDEALSLLLERIDEDDPEQRIVHQVERIQEVVKALGAQTGRNSNGRREMRGFLLRMASPAFRLLEKLSSEGAFRPAGASLGPQTMTIHVDHLMKPGATEMLERIFAEGHSVEIMSAQGEERTKEWFKARGVGESLLAKLKIVEDWTLEGDVEKLYTKAVGGDLQDERLSQVQERRVLVLSQEDMKRLGGEREVKDFINRTGAKVAFGELMPKKEGKRAEESLGSDTLVMALTLASVGRAFKFDEQGRPQLVDGRLVLESQLSQRIEKEIRIILEDASVSKDEIDRVVEATLKDIAENGFFRIPPITQALNDQMRQLLIQETYIEVAA